MPTRHRTEAWRIASLVLVVAAGACSGAGETDAGSDGRADGDAEPADREVSSRDATGDQDAAASDGGDWFAPGEGPVTIVYDSVRASLDRRCDLDGDGLPDNSIADLGGSSAALFAEYVNAVIEAERDPTMPVLTYVRRLEGPAGNPETDAEAAFLFGGVPVEILERGEAVPPEGPFFAHPMSLDGCGEPLFTAERVSLEPGVLVVHGGSLRLPTLGKADGLDARGVVSADGESIHVEACAYAPMAGLGAAPLMLEGREVTLLDLFMAGGRVFGLPTVPGLRPDVDLDGDGLEGVLLDDAGLVEGCVDGDSTVIEGRDCWQDPRMADAFGLSFDLEGHRASLAGRSPAWERYVDAPCPDGPPERSFFHLPSHDTVSCAAFEERCEPFAPEPCCEPAQVCTGLNSRDYRCFEVGCEPPTCDYGGEPGLCVIDEEMEVCKPAWRRVGLQPPCEVGTTGCPTEYGASGDTVCLESVREQTFYMCLESCVQEEAGCEPAYGCMPQLFSVENVCVRGVPE